MRLVWDCVHNSNDNRDVVVWYQISKVERAKKLHKRRKKSWTEAGFPLCGSEERSNRHRRSTNVGGLEMRSILAALLPEGEDRP